MMNENRVLARAIAASALLIATPAMAGSLTPPQGAPSSTMKTLDEIEPRTAVQSLSGAADAAYVIAASGSYYLAGDIQCAQGQHGIRIDAPDVTLDLNGFTIRGTAGSLDGVYCSVISPGTNEGTIRIYGGNVTSCGGNGVTVQNRRTAWLSDLTIARCAGSGLATTDVTNVDVRYTTSTGNGGDGLHIVGDNATNVLVIQTGASSNGGDGIDITDVGNVELSNVDSSNNTGRGGAFSWTQTGGPFKFNAQTASFSNNGGAGTDYDLNRDGVVNLTDFYVLGNGGDGAQVATAANTTLTLRIAGEASANGGNGIHVIWDSTGDLGLSHCSTNGNTLDGVRVSAGVGARLRFANEGSSSSSNGGSGYNCSFDDGVVADFVWKQVSGPYNTFSGIKITGNSASIGGSVRFDGCSTNGNGADGTLIDGAPPVVLSSCSSNNNTGNGMTLTSTSAQLDQCIAAENTNDGVRASSNVPIRHFVTLIALATGGNGGNGTSVIDVDATFDHCSSSGNTGHGYQCSGNDGNNDNWNFQGSSALLNGQDGWSVSGVDPGKIRLDASTSFLNANNGADVTGQNDFATLIDSFASTSDSSGGIVVTGGTLTVSGSTVLLSGGDGLHVDGSTTVTVSGSSFLRCTGNGVWTDNTGVLVFDGSSCMGNGGNGVLSNAGSVTFQGGACSYNTGNGIQTFGTVGTSFVLDGTRSTDNGQAGVVTNGAEDVSDANFYFARNGGGGVVVIRGYFRLEDGTVSGNTGNGVTASAVTAMVVDDLSSQQNTGHGIAVDDGGTGTPSGAVHLANVVCDSNGQDGLNVTSATGVELERSSLTNNTARGAYTEGSGDTRVSGGIVSGNGGGGLVVTGDLDIRGAGVIGNTGDGLTVTGSMTMQSSTVGGNTGRGVVVTGSTNATNCSVAKNGAGGLDVSGNVIFSGGGITNNGGGGLTVTGDLDIRGASVTDNTGDGVTVVPQTAGTYVFELHVSDNTGNGIVVSDGGGGVVPRPVTIDHCAVSNNGQIAIQIQNSVRGLISNNSVTDNGGDGIQVSSSASGLRLSGNTTSGNANGLVVLSTGNLVVGNSSNGNTTDNYSVLTPGNAMGPIVDEMNIATDMSPHANYSF